MSGVSLLTTPGLEGDAAWSWLQGAGVQASERYEIPNLDAALRGKSVVWIHATEPPDLNAERLTAFATSGGGVLLTLRAAALVGPMGIEMAPPNEDVRGVWHPQADEFPPPDFLQMKTYPHVRGLATWGPHPLVDGLHNGTYCWSPQDGEPFARCCYAQGARPTDGRVVAVERAYITQNPSRIVAWEYAVGRGRVLCIGAFVQFAAPSTLLRAQLERLVANALGSVTAIDADRNFWPEPASHASPSEALALPEPLDLEGALAEPGQDPIALESESASDEPWDLAGRRLLLVGTERAGLAEVWVHPHRVISSWTVTADGEPVEGSAIEVCPDAVLRTIETSRRRLTETAFVALEHPIAILDYRAVRKGRASVGQAPPTLDVTFTIDLRRAWPFAAGCGGNLRFRRDARGEVLVVASESDDGKMAVFASRSVAFEVRAVRTAGGHVIQGSIHAPLGVPLRLAIVGGRSREEFERSLRAIRRLGVGGLVRQRIQRALTLREARLSLRAPGTTIGRAIEWAKRRLDALVGDVPDVGRSLFAGYAPSRPGWNEGRPGCAWFFGRDACWSSLALLAAGEHSVPRQVLRFLGDSQDVSGKVIHEVTSSGQYHYDAADSTPLYLLLAARYLAWTGDRDFVRSIWPKIECALSFCVKADADGDGLIELSGVGHGWIESGELGGAHISLYVASVWRAALEGLARTAEALGETACAADCWARAARAADAITASFVDQRKGIHALDVRRGGHRTWTQTALHTAALVLRTAEPRRMKRLLDDVASEDFSAPWGVRLLPVSDPKFNAASFHGGCVWPLFTGWVSIAEYRAGRPEDALRHLVANASLAFSRQLGAFDQALHGTEERGLGACADYACSAAMVILPVVEGLLGVEPDAIGGRLSLSPVLPDEWQWMEAHGVRCGDTVLDVRVRRRANALEVRLRRTSGGPLWVSVAPWLPVASARVTIDEQEVQPGVSKAGQGVRCSVSLEAGAENEIRFE